MRYMHTLQKKLGADGIRLTFFPLATYHILSCPTPSVHQISHTFPNHQPLLIGPNPSQPFPALRRPGRIWRWTPRWFRWARAPWSWTPCRPWHPAAGPRWFLWWRDAVVDGDQTLYEWVAGIKPGWWFGTWILWLSICWECHHPNWRSHFFSEGLKPPTRNYEVGYLRVMFKSLRYQLLRPVETCLVRCLDICFFASSLGS